MQLQIVWFKRDLRTVDHAALAAACASGPVLCLYVVENDYWQLNSTSNRQWLFIRESLIDLDRQLKRLGGELIIVQGDVIAVLDAVKSRFGCFSLHSHQETGNLWTFERDIRVSKWCIFNACQWREYVQNGVFRPASRRRGKFKEYWDSWSNRPQAILPHNFLFVSRLKAGLVPFSLPLKIKDDVIPCPSRQVGGRSIGLSVLHSFISERSRAYRGGISSPLTAEKSCSRLSPYLSQGCLSLKEVIHSVRDAIDCCDDPLGKKSLRDFFIRLWWHCYAMQTLEKTPRMETEALIPEFEQLENPYKDEVFQRWAFGNTGWPLVDACMRFLHHHGWLNFRMRAMLVTVASHSLSIPWRSIANWLAHLFVDFEPGIHFPQIQMHSGMAGNKILRIYNPVKQAMMLDPKGFFVREWVPELSLVNDSWIFEPWLMPRSLKNNIGWNQSFNYPVPIVEFDSVHRQKKALITQLRSELNLEPAPGFNEKPRKTTQKQKSSFQNQQQLGLFD